METVRDAQLTLTMVVMMMRAFAGEPKTLYVALDYAYVSGMTSGMTVTMAPDDAAPDRGA